MPRRSHKKSRQGCQECKRRHLKCDETKPKCINCVTAHLNCPYEVKKRRLDGDTTPASGPGDVDSSRSSTPFVTPTISPAISTSSPFPHTSTDSPLNMLHLELLYHWTTNLYPSFMVGNSTEASYLNTSVKYGLRFPFLMRQILALSALNLSLTRPDHKDFYHQHATRLQSEALTDFNSNLENLDESNILPAFLVSSLVGFHGLCETFSFRGTSFSNTLDSFVGSIKLLRGVRSVIGGWWPFLLASELSPLLQTAHAARERGIQHPYALDALENLIEDADIGLDSKDAYKETVKELSYVFSGQHELNEQETDQFGNMIFAWLVIVPKEYIDRLAARQPEALLILAYYAVILHHRRRFWAVGDAGEYLIENIDQHLGRHWEASMERPRVALKADLLHV